MRTIEEIEKERKANEPNKWRDGVEDYAYGMGMDEGFKTSIRMIQQGKTSADILAYSLADEKEYHSVGDDESDAYQMGYTTALQWAAEQFDWDNEGTPIFREGNGLGFAPGKSLNRNVE